MATACKHTGTHTVSVANPPLCHHWWKYTHRTFVY